MLMLGKDRTGTRKQANQGLGHIQFQVDDALHAVLDKVALKWRCSLDMAARRVLVMALTGWRLRFESQLVGLSRYVRDPTDQFRRTCQMLRHRYDGPDPETGEQLSEEDIEARLCILLDELHEREAAGRVADLAGLLAEIDRMNGKPSELS